MSELDFLAVNVIDETVGIPILKCLIRFRRSLYEKIRKPSLKLKNGSSQLRKPFLKIKERFLRTKEAFPQTSNIFYLGQLNYLEALSLMKQVDAVPLLYNPEIELHKMLFPTKYYESMMVGTPIII